MHQLRESLLDLLSHLEAGFDFADEDLTFITRDALLHRLAESEIAITDIHRQMSSRGDSSDLPRVTLFGRPNTGKSSLFNALVGHDAAMVSHYPGTTRDYLAAMLDFDGAKCLLIDTAGARDLQWTGGAIDDAAESVTAEQRRQSQLPILCIDSSRPLDPWEREQLVCMDSEKQMVVLTKCDLPRQTDDLPAAIETSGKTGRGMNDFRLELRRRMLAVRAQTGDAVAGTAVRCDESLRLAGQCLATARRVALDGQDDLAASEIRGALVELGKIVGTIYTDDVLDRIFSRFCVGK
jgi:tRNA modification GTPase